MSDQKLVRFDWAMKHLLRNKANYDIVEGFLCALLEDNDLKVIEILESESNLEEETDKFNRVDILVKDSEGKNIIIEVQNTRESDYLYRMVYGTSKNISESIDSGDKYRLINKVISVSILYFDLGIGDDYLYYGQTEFVGLNTHEVVNKNSESVQKLIPKGSRYNQVEIFPEYYLIQVDKYQNVVRKAIDEWVFWFKNEKVKEGSRSKNIEQVAEKLRIMKMDKESRNKYNRFLERLASEKDILETAKEEGREEIENQLIPIIEEKEQVIEEKEQVIEEKEQVIEEKEQVIEEKEQVIEEKEQVIEEKKQALLKSAKLMKQADISLEQIQESTGLSIAEIQEI